MSGRVQQTMLLLGVACAAFAAACASQQGGSASESDSARVVRLDREARALARADGCDDGAQCRAAPMGDRPCGGPREYLVYCVRTTDTVALNRKLAELVEAERAYNQKTGMASTCEFRLPPQTSLVAGSCRAVQAH